MKSLTAIEITQAVAICLPCPRASCLLEASLKVCLQRWVYAIKVVLAAFAEAVRLETQPHGGHVLLVFGLIQRVSASDPSHIVTMIKYGIADSPIALHSRAVCQRLLDAENSLTRYWLRASKSSGTRPPEKGHVSRWSH